MEIDVVLHKGKWVATIKMDGWADSARADRPGCAIRDVLNRFQYQFGAPSGDMKVVIDGW